MCCRNGNSRLKLNMGKFSLNVRKSCQLTNLIRQWNSFPEEMAEIYCWSYLKLTWPKHQGIHRGRNRSQNLEDWYIEQLGFCIFNSYDYQFRISICNNKYVIFTSITLKIKTLYYSIEISTTIFKYILISCNKDSTILSLLLHSLYYYAKGNPSRLLIFSFLIFTRGIFLIYYFNFHFLD